MSKPQTVGTIVATFLHAHKNNNKRALVALAAALQATVMHGNWAPLARLYTETEGALPRHILAATVAVYPDAKFKADKGQPSGVRLERGEAPASMPNLAMLQTLVDSDESIYGKKFRDAFMPKVEKEAEAEAEAAKPSDAWEAVLVSYSALTPEAQAKFRAALDKMTGVTPSDLEVATGTRRRKAA